METFKEGVILTMKVQKNKNKKHKKKKTR